MHRPIGPVLALGALACGSPNPQTSRSDPPDRPTASVHADQSLETFVEPLEIVAGTSAIIRCVVSQDRQSVPGVPTAVLIAPSNPGNEDSLPGPDNVFHWSPTIGGIYAVRCQTLDGLLADPHSVTVSVVPAGLAHLETVLSESSAQAGAPVTATCNAADAFGNSTATPLNVLLDHDSLLSVDPPAGPGFVVRGSLIGTFSVACRSAEFVDETPALLLILAGIPGASDTTVSATAVLPGQEVAVQCAVRDAFGNPLPEAPADLVVLPEQGNLEDAGLTINAAQQTFSATAAGVYDVFCRVPGYRAGDESPAQVTVYPGLPHHWVVELSSQDCYWQDRALPLSVMVYDRWNNPIDLGQSGNLLAVSVHCLGPCGTPLSVTVDSVGLVRVVGEGFVELDVALGGPVDPQADLSPFVSDFTVDSTPPIATLTMPARSAMISQGTASNPSNISIVGSVSDGASAISELTVLGVAQPISGASLVEPVATTQISRWGLNVITGRVVDACGNQRSLAQSYLRSRETHGYFPAATAETPSARAQTGLLAHLNQVILDDYFEEVAANPNGAWDRARADLDDVASLAQSAVAAVNWDAALPNPLILNNPTGRSCACSCGNPGCVFGCGCACCPWELSCDNWLDPYYRVDHGPITLDQPRIDFLQATTGGLRFSASLPYVYMPLSGSLQDYECALGIGPLTTGAELTLSGSVTATHDTATGILNIGLAGSPPVPTVSLANLVLDVPIHATINCGWVQFICDFITDIFQPQIQSLVEDELTQVVQDEVPPIVQGFLSNFTLETDFALPPPLSVDVALHSGFDAVSFDGPAVSFGGGWGELGLYVQIHPATRGPDSVLDGTTFSIPMDAGAIRKGGTPPSFDPTAYAFGLGLKDDTVNQILWALWYGGGLDLSNQDVQMLASDIDLSAMDLHLFATLPPVVMPGSGTVSGSGARIDVGLGDTYVDATVDLGALFGATGTTPLHLGMYLSALVGGELNILTPVDTAANQILINLDDDAAVFVEVVTIDDPGYQGPMSDVLTALFKILLPRVLSSALGAFPLPDFDLSGLANLPAGTILRLRQGALDRPSDRYFRLTGALRP